MNDRIEIIDQETGRQLAILKIDRIAARGCIQITVRPDIFESDLTP